MTTKRKLYMTAHDLQRLQDYLDNLHPDERKKYGALESEFARAARVESEKVPASVVTMNSRLRYRDLDNGELSEISLVFPGDADVDDGKMSVLSPLGTALLGYAVNDEIEWQVPGGVRRIKIEALLYQPEAAGDLHL